MPESGASGPPAAARVARVRTALGETPLGARVALVLWAAFAFCVWNVVFDRVVVLAGRRYVYAAAVSAASEPPAYLRIDDWMRPARAHAFRLATGAGGVVFVVGLAGVAVARRRGLTSPESPRRS